MKQKGLNIHIKPQNRRSFTSWCKKQGYSSGSSASCIAKGKKSKSPKIRKKAVFAQNFAK